MNNEFRFFQIPIDGNKHLLTYGTIIAEWQDTGDTIDIISILNTNKGNGHFVDFYNEMKIYCIDFIVNL